MTTKTEDIVLYRGIAVSKESSEEVRKKFLEHGIHGDEGKQWKFEMNDLKDKLENLIQKSDLTTEDTRPSSPSDWFPVICACGDEIGAAYYALIHNTHINANEMSFVIKFVAPLSDVTIDGRDFLYTCFQLWDRKNSKFVKLQTRWLSKIYGKKIVKYFEKAISSKETNHRIAMCDLACQDAQVIKDHATNQTLIKGRHNTTFCSAFFVRVPIEPPQIISVEAARYIDFEPHITLHDFIEGKLDDVA